MNINACVHPLPQTPVLIKPLVKHCSIVDSVCGTKEPITWLNCGILMILWSLPESIHRELLHVTALLKTMVFAMFVETFPFGIHTIEIRFPI